MPEFEFQELYISIRRGSVLNSRTDSRGCCELLALEGYQF